MPRPYNKESSMHRKAYLGDHIESALSFVGITSERVSKWIGKPCGCQVRRDKLNALHLWIERVLKGKYNKDEKGKESAEKHLDIIMMEDENNESSDR